MCIVVTTYTAYILLTSICLLWICSSQIYMLIDINEVWPQVLLVFTLKIAFTRTLHIDKGSISFWDERRIGGLNSAVPPKTFLAPKLCSINMKILKIMIMVLSKPTQRKVRLNLLRNELSTWLSWKKNQIIYLQSVVCLVKKLPDSIEINWVTLKVLKGKSQVC